MRPVCFCGCGRKHGVQFHHAVYQQELRQVAGTDMLRQMTLCSDRRNLVPAGPKCHAAHHNRSHPYALRLLPASVFEFAGEVLGPGPAYEYLRRRYSGEDPRLDALLSAWEQEA